MQENDPFFAKTGIVSNVILVRLGRVISPKLKHDETDFFKTPQAHAADPRAGAAIHGRSG